MSRAEGYCVMRPLVPSVKGGASRVLQELHVEFPLLSGRRMLDGQPDRQARLGSVVAMARSSPKTPLRHYYCLDRQTSL